MCVYVLLSLWDFNGIITEASTRALKRALKPTTQSEHIAKHPYLLYTALHGDEHGLAISVATVF